MGEQIKSSENFNLTSFYERLGEGTFLVVRCKNCSKYLLPPSPVCNRCMSRKLEWVPLSDVGKVVSFSEVHVSTDAFNANVPYVVAIIETDRERVRLPGIVRGASRSQIDVGTRVRIKIDEKKEEEGGGERLLLPGYYFVLEPEP